MHFTALIDLELSLLIGVKTRRHYLGYDKFVFSHAVTPVLYSLLSIMKASISQ